MQVVRLALEQRMRRDGKEDVEIARGRAAHADLALAGQPDAGAVLDSGGDVDREVLLLAHAAGAVAPIAGLLDDLAGAAAGMTGALDGEEALAGPDAAGSRCSSGLGRTPLMVARRSISSTSAARSAWAYSRSWS